MPQTPDTTAAFIGQPEDIQYFPGAQSYPDTCAIRCQEFIIERFTGHDIPEDDLVRLAYENGWYTPGSGTNPEDVGKLLEVAGIPVTTYPQANIYHLTSELAQGHKVIIGVDSGELWDSGNVNEIVSDLYGEDGSDHAVVVTGIDTRDPNQTYVIVSDPGNGEAASRYPLEQFLDAWRDCNFYMVATQNAPPSLYSPEMANFDYLSGHIPEIAGVPYSELSAFETQPSLWGDFIHRAVEVGSATGLGVGSSDPKALMMGQLKSMLSSFTDSIGLSGGDAEAADRNDDAQTTSQADMDAALDRLSRLISANPEVMSETEFRTLSAALEELISRAEAGDTEAAAALNDALAKLNSIDTVADVASRIGAEPASVVSKASEWDTPPAGSAEAAECCPTAPCHDACDPDQSSVSGDCRPDVNLPDHVNQAL